MDQSITSILLDCLGYSSNAAKTERLSQVSAEEWGMVAYLALQHQAFLKNMLRMMRFFHDITKLLRLMQENGIVKIHWTLINSFFPLRIDIESL
jgi:hypothetical protein